MLLDFCRAAIVNYDKTVEELCRDFEIDLEKNGEKKIDFNIL